MNAKEFIKQKMESEKFSLTDILDEITDAANEIADEKNSEVEDAIMDDLNAASKALCAACAKASSQGKDYEELFSPDILRSLIKLVVDMDEKGDAGLEISFSSDDNLPKIKAIDKKAVLDKAEDEIKNMFDSLFSLIF